MKIVYIELFFINSKLKEIKLNTIRKYKNKYYFDCVFKIEYQNEYLQDIIIHLIKKANLEKTPILINYIFDNITFLKITIPKMKSIQMIKNIDTEINQLIYNYKDLYDYEITKVSTYKINDFRIVLFPKLEEKYKLNQVSLKEVKVNKIKEIKNYEIIETIIKGYHYKLNTLYSIVCFNENNIECYILRNGFVIELFIIDVDKTLLDQYNLSYKYTDLLNVNNQYFKNICDLISEYGSSRSVEAMILVFSSKYNDYLKNLINQEININHISSTYEEVFLKALEGLFNEK
mgnify:CR=1 FL=1